MGNLIFGINITIDGCCDHTKGGAYPDVHEYFAQLNREADVLLYGRKTYELMVPFWPDMARNHIGPADAISNFADSFVSVDKIVVCSRSLQSVDYKNTSIIGANLKDEVLKLKAATTGNIITGGVDIPTQLIQLGLVDEMRVVVQPIFAGAGRRLADNLLLDDGLHFKLADTQMFESGCVALRYVR